jgi:hypothetical protein
LSVAGIMIKMKRRNNLSNFGFLFCVLGYMARGQTGTNKGHSYKPVPVTLFLPLLVKSN